MTRPFGWTAHAPMVACAACGVWGDVNGDRLCRSCCNVDAPEAVPESAGYCRREDVPGLVILTAFRGPARETWGDKHSPVPAGAIVTTMAACNSCGYLTKPGRACPKC